jgi:hypothetical protein
MLVLITVNVVFKTISQLANVRKVILAMPLKVAFVYLSLPLMIHAIQALVERTQSAITETVIVMMTISEIHMYNVDLNVL